MEITMKRDEKLVNLIQEQFEWGPLNSRSAVRANFKCEYCDASLIDSLNAYDSWQIDHIVPKSKDGPDCLDNVALSCRACNLLKHDHDPSGKTRQSRLEDARKFVHQKRDKKQEELDKLRRLIEETGFTIDD